MSFLRNGAIFNELRFRNLTTLRTASSRVHALAQRGHSSAEVVIIGGGAVGASAAYHLAKNGLRNVVLLEKSELTSGSTWHAAGLCTYFHPSINLKRINYYSIELYKKLQEETGQDVGLHCPGSLRICSTPIRVDEAKYQITRQHWNQAQHSFLGPDEIRTMCPLLNMDKVLAGIFTPGDGHIDPYSLTQALATGARLYGAELYQHSPVKSMKLRSDGLWDVETEHGTLTSKHVINAAGFWAREVAQMVGLDIPIVPVHHQFVITSPIPEVAALPTEMPVLRDLDGSYYLRQERQGLLFGPYEAPEKMKICNDWIDNGVPPNFGKELFHPDLERIMPHVEAAMEMVPVLQKAQIQTIISGPITYNCENAPLLGPVCGFPNYWLMVGFGYGIIQAGGAGRFIADWISNGEPPHELIDLDADRYGKWWTKEYALTKARETYGLNNLIGYPKEERWGGRPSPRCSSLYKDLADRGAQFGFHSGWEQPHWFARTKAESTYQPSFRRTNWFPAMERECRLVLDGAGIVDLTTFAKFEVSGPRASEFLDLVTANNLPKVGHACISHMLTERGRVFAELTLTRMGENKYLVVTGSGSEFHDLRWLECAARERNFPKADLHIENNSDRLGVLGIAGPLSRRILQRLTSADLGVESFKFLQHKQTQVAGIMVDAIRISYTGELGWELYCSMEDLVPLYRALHEAGSQDGVDDFGSFAMNSLRMEKGFRMWGNDMNVNTNPIEAGLGFFVKEKKASNFIGKTAISKILQEGVTQKLVFLRVDTTDVDPEGNETVWLGDKVVGNTTSGTFGFQVGYSLAMAYLPVALAQDGVKVEVELLGDRRSAVVMLHHPIKVQAVREREAAKGIRN